MQTPEEIVDGKTQLATLLWKLQILNREAAEFCGVQERTIYKWLEGDRKVPKSVLKLLELMLEKKTGTIGKWPEKVPASSDQYGTMQVFR